MPLYFFHVRDGLGFKDETGTALPDLAAAKEEAIRFAGALLLEQPSTFWEQRDWTMRITDDRDLTLFYLTFFATPGAANVFGEKAFL